MKGAMEPDGPLLHERQHVPVVTTEDTTGSQIGTVATRDRDVIRRWAERRHAQPATGEATASGPATADIHDGGAGIRFNFPGVGRLRPITWDEWFDNFERHQLTFVYEVQPKAYESSSPRYRIVKTEDWSARIG